MSDQTLLLKNADVLCTMAGPDGCENNAKEEIKNGGLFARNGIIETVAESNSLPQTADTIIDMKGHVVIPGMVNTHHHLFQNLTRAVPAAQNSELFGWLKTLYPIWSNIGPEHVYWSTALGLAELALSGCTTSSDHLYIYPNGAKLDDSLSAAADIGVRFHGTRGSMSTRLLGLDNVSINPDRSEIRKESTIAREAYFLSYTEELKKLIDIPLMVTGGFRSKVAMEAAINKKACEIIGIGRPLCVDPFSVKDLLEGKINQLPAAEKTLSIGPGWLSLKSPFRLIQALNAFSIQSWFYIQIKRISEGLNPDLLINPFKAFRIDGKNNKKSINNYKKFNG